MVGFEKPRTPLKTSGFGRSTAYHNFSVVPGTPEILALKVGYPQNKSEISYMSECVCWYYFREVRLG